MNTTEYAVKISNDQAVVYNARTGVLVRHLGYKVQTAQVLGKLVQVTSQDGKVQVYDAASVANWRRGW